MENLDPPSPQIKDGKMARFCPSRGFILDLGDGGLLFHFTLSKIVAYYPRRPFSRFFYLILQFIYNTYLFHIVQVKTETLPHRRSEHLSEFHS